MLETFLPESIAEIIEQGDRVEVVLKNGMKVISNKTKFNDYDKFKQQVSNCG